MCTIKSTKWLNFRLDIQKYKTIKALQSHSSCEMWKTWSSEEWAKHVVYWVNQKFKDHNSIDASPYTELYVYHQLMGVFCDRLKFGSTVARDCRTGQNKDRYCKKELLLLLILLSSSCDRQTIGLECPTNTKIKSKILKGL